MSVLKRYDIRDDFRTQIGLDFPLDFMEDPESASEDELIAYRTKQKQRLHSLLEIEPEVEYDENNIELYHDRAIISLPLVPFEEYTIEMSPFETII